jgi:hypothetical protein
MLGETLFQRTAVDFSHSYDYLFTLAVGLLFLLLPLFISKREKADINRYSPALAWLRAFIYFSVAIIISRLSGVLNTVFDKPLYTDQQIANPTWLASTAVIFAVLIIAYGFIWPKGTFTDQRQFHPASIFYGLCWGFCHSQVFLSAFAIMEITGLSTPWAAVTTYCLLSAANYCWQIYYWDIHVSPPHNIAAWNLKKVYCCHAPNLVLMLTYITVFGNVGVFVALQTLCLCYSAITMRFPTPWSSYSAKAGEER